jgi:predicted O-linked N-acetylglucosamine transferase (SPINDLY family)
MTTPAQRAQAQQQLQLALAMHRAGRFGLAESHYLRVVKLDAAQDEAWHLLGVVAFQQGLATKAIKHFRKALELRPRHAQALNNLALALKATGDFVGARDAFAAALEVRPEYVEAALNLGLLEEARGDFVAAESVWRQALAWRPDDAAVLTCLGNLMRRLERSEEAVAVLSRVHNLAAGAESAGNLALALIDVGRYREARALAETACSEEPDTALWREALGTAARLEGDAELAVAALEQAVAMPEASAGTWLELGLARNAAGQGSDARGAFAEASRRAPMWPKARWLSALALDPLNGDDVAIEADLARYADGLDRIEGWLARDRTASVDALLEASASVSNLHLHYRPRDTRGLHERFGDLVGAVVARAVPALADPPARRDGGDRLRVGVIGSFFGRHSVSRYFNALVGGLDPRRFEVRCWSTADAEDGVSAALAARVAAYERVRGTLAGLGGAIRNAELDVLVFPDMGLDPRQQVIASMRLAPVQLALAGHPVSTGLRTIDTFLSGAALEPVDADAHYRERLIRLPGLGAAPTAPNAVPHRAWFDAWRDPRPTIVCAQGLPKLTPAFELAVTRILREADARLIVFDRGHTLGRRWLAGLAERLSGADLDVERSVTVLPVRPYAEFLGALAGADLVLDTPWFSGGATSLDAIAIGAPVLAWQSPYARGRQTGAMLGLCGCPELVADGADDYVARALDLLRDRERHADLGARLAAAAPRLFDPAPVVAAFERVLVELAGFDRSSAGG